MTMSRMRGEAGGGRQGKGKRGEQETVETVERENDEGKALTQYLNLIMRLQDSIGQHTIEVYSTLFQD